MANERLADARDMFAVHTMFRREFGLMVGLALEEERVGPLIEKYITTAEYALLSQEGNAEVPQDKLPAIFGMIMDGADPTVIDAIVAEMPAQIQPVIKDVAVLAYAASAQQLHGTAAPARVTGSPQR
jgi:hypothetical protein